MVTRPRGKQLRSCGDAFNNFSEGGYGGSCRQSFRADELPDTPIGVAFVDAKGEPGWIRRDPSLRVHYPSLRGCWPTVH